MYHANGKTYTDHPLMDEICYNCKRILKNIIIKNDVLANDKETENSINNAEMYIIYRRDGIIPFEVFIFNYDILYQFYKNDTLARIYLEDKYMIPIVDRTSLTDFANNWFIENFVEENDYYRMLMGLPPFEGIKKDGSNEYDIFLTEEDLPSGYNGSFYPAKPLHEQELNLISILYSDGIIDKLRKEVYMGSNYSYMMYLGARQIDLYDARTASKWDILYMPNVYYLVEDAFKETYKINKEIYLNRSYQDFFAETGDYYDQMMILLLLAQTFTDMITDTPEWYIRRDIFDIRSCEYFLTSYGVAFYKVIPLKFQIRLVKNLNKLIKFKSTNKNAQDILDIFSMPEASIYKYWLYKKYVGDGKYELEFISSDMNEGYDDYIKNSSYRTPYEDITLQDKYWDGEDTHSYIEQLTKDIDFTIHGTKFMSVEYHISMKEYLYQMSYLLGAIMDSDISFDKLTIGIPTIDETAEFRLSDLFLFLVVLTNAYYNPSLDDKGQKIIIIDKKEPNVIPAYTHAEIAAGVDEKNYSWMKKYFPEMFINKTGRVLGFNTKLNTDFLKKELERRHSYYRFGQDDESYENRPLVGQAYTRKADVGIKELGIDDFQTNVNITNIRDFISFYRHNTEIYNNLKEKMESYENYDMKVTLEYVFQEMFTKEFNINDYLMSNGKIATSLEELLADRNYVLYNTLIGIMSESNQESRQDLLRAIISDTVDTLEYYLSGPGMNYLFAFTATQSFYAIIYYMYLILNFFKSYKVYFLDPYVTLINDDKVENSAKPVDNVAEWRYERNMWDKSFSIDNIVGFNVERDFTDTAYKPESTEIMDIYAYHQDDPLLDHDYNGANPEEGESHECKDVDGGLVEDSSQFPYVDLNAGAPYLGMINYNDLNGGKPDERYKEYHDIDGGLVYDPDITKTDRQQSFVYEFDGASPSGRRFINNITELKLIGTELLGDIKISPREKNLKLTEEGLFYPDNFVTVNQFNNVIKDIQVIIDKVTANGKTAFEDLFILKDMDAIVNRIKTLVSGVTYNFEYSNNQLLTDTFENRVRTYIDTVVELFMEEYPDTPETANPYYWEDLD